MSWVAVSPGPAQGPPFSLLISLSDPSVLPTLSLSGSCPALLKKPAVPWLLSPLLLLEKARPSPVLSLGGAGVGELEERRQSKAPGGPPTWPLQVWGLRGDPGSWF